MDRTNQFSPATIRRTRWEQATAREMIVILREFQRPTASEQVITFGPRRDAQLVQQDPPSGTTLETTARQWEKDVLNFPPPVSGEKSSRLFVFSCDRKLLTCSATLIFQFAVRLRPSYLTIPIRICATFHAYFSFLIFELYRACIVQVLECLRRQNCVAKLLGKAARLMYSR